MVIKVYISGNSGNKEIVTHQQRIFMILKSLGIDCAPVDIAGPGMDEAREFMRANGKKKDGQRNVLPPQIFNEEKYCGDYDDFDIANEDDLLEEFLGIPKKDPLGGPQVSATEDPERQKKAKESSEAGPTTESAEPKETGETEQTPAVTVAEE